MPDELRVAYDVYTNGTYTIIKDLLYESEVDVTKVGAEDEDYRQPDTRSVWEWIAKSMMTRTDFDKVTAHMQKKLIDITKLENDPKYLESNKKNINVIFKNIFGSKGPNAKGLIMLSQRSHNSQSGKSYVIQGCCCWENKKCHDFLGKGGFEETSCLYVGDADLKSKVNNKMVQDFLTYHRTGTTLLLMQIPHHGSHNNIGDQFETEFSSKYYFVNDVDTKRLQQSVNLFKSLQRQKKLLVSRELCQDVILTRTIM